MLASGCGGAPTAAPTNDKYTQTWKTPYGTTTCAQFRNEMTDHQRWVMAVDMLVGARKVNSKDAGMPSDAMVDEFEGGLKNVCVIVR